jgi:hypothetical protein
MEAFIVVLNSLIPSSLLWWFVRTRLVSSLQRNFHPQHKEKRNFISCGSLFFVLPVPNPWIGKRVWRYFHVCSQRSFHSREGSFSSAECEFHGYILDPHSCLVFCSFINKYIKYFACSCKSHTGAQEAHYWCVGQLAASESQRFSPASIP